MQIQVRDVKRGKRELIGVRATNPATRKLVNAEFTKDEFVAVLELMKASHRAGLFGEGLHVQLLPDGETDE